MLEMRSKRNLFLSKRSLLEFFKKDILKHHSNNYMNQKSKWKNHKQITIKYLAGNNFL